MTIEKMALAALALWVAVVLIYFNDRATTESPSV